MDSRASATLLMLSLVALLAVGAAAADDIIRLPGDAVMEEARPWTCCDHPVCTDAGLCGCKDVVKECTCKKCRLVPGGFMCRDASPGGEPPRCTAAGN